MHASIGQDLVIVLEAVGGQRDVAARVGGALALVLLVAEVLAAHRAQNLVGLVAVPVLAELVHIYTCEGSRSASF